MEQYKVIFRSDPGMIFGNQPEHALSVSKNEQNQKEEEEPIYAGDGYDAAQGMDEATFSKLMVGAESSCLRGKNDILKWFIGDRA